MQTKQPSKLQSYLTGLGGVTLLATTSNAAVIQMNIGAISGTDAGVASGSSKTVDLSTLGSGLTGSLIIDNNFIPRSGYQYTGLGGTGGEMIAIAGQYASPKAFTLGSSIGSSSAFSNVVSRTVFDSKYFFANYSAPVWGAGSYMGFKSANSCYGWLQVTWNPSTSTFQIYSGAYESTPNTSILIAPIPEPSSLALLVAGGSAVLALRRRKAA